MHVALQSLHKVLLVKFLHANSSAELTNNEESQSCQHQTLTYISAQMDTRREQEHRT